MSIDLCFEKKALLPFAIMDALTVGDAFQIIVRWDIGSLQLMAQMKGTGMPESNEANAALGAQNVVLSYREVWKDKRVQLWNESKTHVVAEGVVMYVCPFDLINFSELGKDNIGIGIETSYGGDDSVSLADVCSITLVSWPIKRVTTMDGKSLLQYEDLHTLDESPDTYDHSALCVEPISRKRKYCFINRKPKVSLQPSKKVSQVSLSSVQLVLVIDCCPKRCC